MEIDHNPDYARAVEVFAENYLRNYVIKSKAAIFDPKKYQDLAESDVLALLKSTISPGISTIIFSDGASWRISFMLYNLQVWINSNWNVSPPDVSGEVVLRIFTRVLKNMCDNARNASRAANAVQLPQKGQKFFEERSDQSEVKARIVSKYFKAWAKIIAPMASVHHGKMAYIDLYAGPGRYKDGASSTPLMVLETAIDDHRLREMLVTVFNEGDKETADTLSEEIKKLPGVDRLKFPPVVHNTTVGESIADMLSRTKLVPSFSFVDPFGYKGLSQKIINGVIKDWGCDCVLFFNYNRINAGISNDKVVEHMNALFGPERAAALRAAVAGQDPAKRELLVIEAIAQSIKQMGGTFVLPFRFRSETGKRLSHCLIFVSKHVLGYNVMKEIMYKESSTFDQNVASFAYSPADAATPLLFSLSRPIDGLALELLNVFKGKTLTMEQIFNYHHVDTPFIKRNYKDALLELENSGAITTQPEPHLRRVIKGVRSFAEHVLVTFPQ